MLLISSGFRKKSRHGGQSDWPRWVGCSSSVVRCPRDHAARKNVRDASNWEESWRLMSGSTSTESTSARGGIGRSTTTTFNVPPTVICGGGAVAQLPGELKR